MKTSKSKLILMSFLLTGFTVSSTGLAQSYSIDETMRPPEEFSAQDKQCEFRSAMRKLWEDHITWTRVFIISGVAGLGDTNFAAQRLLKNQDDIGKAIVPFYGTDAGNQLSMLLREHILLAAEILKALKAGKTDTANAAIKKWYTNADKIAAFLHMANPKNWPAAEMKNMMHEHLDLTTKEVAARLKGKWKADIAAYDMVHVQILMMADMLSSGIIKQFPAKF